MKKAIIVLLLILAFVIGLTLGRYNFGGVGEFVPMHHYLEVTFPKMEKQHGTH
jgi:hypothetical protein